MSALSVAPPLLFRQIIDNGILQGDRRVVIILSVTVAGVGPAAGRARTSCSGGFLRRSARV